jgi:two-component system OmpR family sensor kinase
MNAKPLGAIITRRLLLVALAVFLLQLAYVAVDLASRSNEIEEAVVERELARVGADVVPAGPSARVDIDEDEARHYDDYPNAYGYELSTADGSIVDWRNPALFEGRPVELSAGAIQGMQRDTIDGKERLVALRRIAAAGGNYVVRVAAIGDPAGLYAREFMKQILDRVMLPIVPLTAIMLVVMLLVVRQALRPVERAATGVAAISGPDQAVRLDLSGAPAEVVALGSAVNGLLDRLELALAQHREFAANIAHELRTPLSLLTLEMGKIESPAAARMHEDVQSLTRLVDQLLAVARIEAVKPEDLETLDLAEIAKSVVMRMAPAAIAEGRELELDVAQAVDVEGEREAIAGALRNLVENAMRAAPVGSAVRVKVGPGSEVAVIDTGPGIPETEIPRIFDRYRQGDRKTCGSAGLGLSIVKRTMERHGGTVSLATAAGQGCAFTLIFPAPAAPLK